jgi:hypothetical protein
VPRQAPVTVYSYGLLTPGGEFSFQSQIAPRTSNLQAYIPDKPPPGTYLDMLHDSTMDMTGWTDMESVPVCPDGQVSLNGCKIHDFQGYLPNSFAFALNATTDMEPPGGMIQFNEILYLVAFSYTGVNPLPPEATLNPRASNNTYFGWNTYVYRNDSFESASAAAMVELQDPLLASAREWERSSIGFKLNIRR